MSFDTCPTCGCTGTHAQEVALRLAAEARLAMVDEWAERNSNAYWMSNEIKAGDDKVFALKKILSSTPAPLAVVRGIVSKTALSQNHEIVVFRRENSRVSEDDVLADVIFLPTKGE